MKTATGSCARRRGLCLVAWLLWDLRLSRLSGLLQGLRTVPLRADSERVPGPPGLSAGLLTQCLDSLCTTAPLPPAPAQGDQLLCPRPVLPAQRALLWQGTAGPGGGSVPGGHLEPLEAAGGRPSGRGGVGVRGLGESSGFVRAPRGGKAPHHGRGVAGPARDSHSARPGPSLLRGSVGAGTW